MHACVHLHAGESCRSLSSLSTRAAQALGWFLLQRAQLPSCSPCGTRMQRSRLEICLRSKPRTTTIIHHPSSTAHRAPRVRARWPRPSSFVPQSAALEKRVAAAAPNLGCEDDCAVHMCFAAHPRRADSGVVRILPDFTSLHKAAGFMSHAQLRSRAARASLWPAGEPDCRLVAHTSRRARAHVQQSAACALRGKQEHSSNCT